MKVLLVFLSLSICGVTTQQTNNDTIFIAGITDAKHNFSKWFEDIFNFTLKTYIPEAYPEILNRVNLTGEVAESDCTASKATRAYGELRKEYEGMIHGIVGCRCSDETIAVARVAELDDVPILSPTSTSSKLSNKEEFPYVTTMVSPDDKRGQVGAIIALFEKFGWDRVNILNTDTIYALDLSTEFQNTWTAKGKHVAYSGTIRMSSTESNQGDEESVRASLDGISGQDVKSKSRIIFLIAHDRHAYSILETARNQKFQKDAIWVGPQAWAGLLPSNTAWMPENPGYLGVGPYRNKDQQAQTFLQLYRKYQNSQGISPVWSEFPPYYGAEFAVDAIVAMAMVLSAITPVEQRRNATLVSTQLRALNFSGVSGPVSFTANGTRYNPQFTIYNLQQEDDGSYHWEDVGQTGITSNSTSFHQGASICFADVGCEWKDYPSDTYKVPISPVTLAFAIVGPLVFASFVFALSKYIRTKRKKRELKKDLANQARDVQELQRKTAEADEKMQREKDARNALILERGKMERPHTWTDSGDQILVELSPNNDEYWAVTNKFRETMTNAHVSKIWRIQNINLWSYYLFHKDRFARTVNDVTERDVWHGTSHIDPELIYNDSQDGFMVQFARDGLFGRGNYFAAKSSYSHKYRYDATKSMDPCRARGEDGEYEMFYVRLLVGKQYVMARNERNEKLSCPPIDPSSGTKRLKFNTVKGHTGGSDVWIVYENGRAYPLYIVRYYCGDRDPIRTPFEKKEDASTNMGDVSRHESNRGVWKFEDDDGWKPYSQENQSILRQAYKAYKDDGGPQTVLIKAGNWNYEVDFESMIQTNVRHKRHRNRKIFFEENKVIAL